MSVIKLSTPAASCWTVCVVEGPSPATKSGLSGNRKVPPWLVSHALGAQLILGSPMIFSTVLYHFYDKAVFATSRLACELCLGFSKLDLQERGRRRG